MRVLLALAALLVFAPAASAAPLIGIGEQHPQIFTDEAFTPLGIRDVRYVASYDALNDPVETAEWRAAFDFILEVYTLQVLPDPDLRSRAIANMAAMLRHRGEILVIARGRELYDSPGEMPWPLTKEDLRSFTDAGLIEISFEDFPDPESPETRRFRVLYRRN